MNRRMLLDLATRRSDELAEVQILYFIGFVVGLPVVELWALGLAYLLVQFSELHGMLLVRRIFAAARDPGDMLARYRGPAIWYEWISAAALALALGIALTQAVSEWHIGVLAVWCLAITYFVFPTIYCVRSLYGCILIQSGAMAVTVLYCAVAFGNVSPNVTFANLGLALFAGATAGFMGRQLRADYVAKLEKERALATSVREMDRINALKTEFMSHLSHELRTPMNGMMGIAKLLQGGRLSRDQHEMVQLMLDSGRRMTRLLGNSMDLSRLEADAIRLSIAPGSLRETVSEVIAVHESAARRAGQRLDFHCDPDVPEILGIDTQRVRQCLDNLISNAVKFAGPGVVSVGLEMAARQDPPMARIVVRDHGAGIAPSSQDAVFDPYARADAGASRTFHGAGIGLALSRRLARLMGGDVVCESTLGVGSAFTLSFRVHENLVQDKSSTGDAAGAGATVTGERFVSREFE